MTPLHMLALEAGIAREWTDADGVARCVADDSLRAILAALGLPAETEDAIAESRIRLRVQQAQPPTMLTADAGEPILLPAGWQGKGLSLLDEAGDEVDLALSADGPTLGGLPTPGYYRLTGPQGEIGIAVAPERCPSITDKTDGRRAWGASIQIPSLRDGGGAFGDFGSLARAVRALGERGADAVALSPVHAQFAADPGRFAPYSPSSRLFLNGLLAPVDGPDTDPDDEALIDWRVAGPERMASLRAAFARIDDAARRALERFMVQGSEPLARQIAFDRAATKGTEPAAFLAWLQWRAHETLRAAQQAARDAGMAIGLIADLAVGVDPAGSDVAADPGAFLMGLTVGAPPDPLGPLGQDWGLTSYSPQGLLMRGFAPFIAMLRASLPRGGGIRIDHAFGLQRLWVVPAGMTAADGAYLSYPFEDLLRIVKIEAHRADAIVIAEDLGTRPPGFAQALESAGIYGMAVLPFQRDEAGGFLDAAAYPRTAVAMSGTHDTATLAGWWTGRDLEWNRVLDRGGETQEKRALARTMLWDRIGGGVPPPADPAALIVSAFVFLGKTPTPLLLVPMEDVAGLDEQPNIPGTIDEHPNWRRRLPAPVDALLDRPDIAARIDGLATARRT